jgi:histidinol-phosphate phosphatase family protein
MSSPSHLAGRVTRYLPPTSTSLTTMATSTGAGRPGVLLDRDGTIIVDHGYVGSVERVELLAGAAEAIAKFNQAGIPVAVVTNQSGVARGYYGVEDVEAVHRYISQKLADLGAHIDLYLFCPYHPDGVVEAFARETHDRKPRPGMALAAAEALGLDLARSWVIGDRPEVMALAEAVGASAAWVGSGTFDKPGVHSFPGLAAAAPFVLSRAAAIQVSPANQEVLA